MAGNPRIKYDGGSGFISGNINKYAHDAHAFRKFVNKRGKKMLLAVVADDQSPFQNGDHPSDIAINITVDFFSSKIFEELKSDKDYPGLEAAIRGLFAHINKVLYDRSQIEENRVKVSMSAVFVVDETMFVGHVGKGKILRLRDEETISLASDSSWFSQATKIKGMTVSEALSSSNMMESKCLGLEPAIEIDFKMDNLIIDDRVLVCTDGVGEYISDEEIQVIIKSVENFPGACIRLTEIARNRGLRDEGTAVLFSILSMEEVQKKSVEEITGVEEEKPKGGTCGIIYFIILFGVLFVIMVALYVGYKHGMKLLRNLTKSRTSSVEPVREPGVAPDIPGGKYFLILDEESLLLNVFKLNKKKLDVRDLRYELPGEEQKLNELEIMPIVHKGTYSIILTVGDKDDYRITEGSERNLVRVYADNVRIYLTGGCGANINPQGKGGLAQVRISGLGSPVFVFFGQENVMLKIEKDK